MYGHILQRHSGRSAWGGGLIDAEPGALREYTLFHIPPHYMRTSAAGLYGLLASASVSWKLLILLMAAG